MQSWALLVDSYRLLMSRKLFWITLIISAVVVAIYASIGFNETGWSVFFGAFHFDSETIRAGSPWAETLYLGIFSQYVVGIWLSWAAIILALVSTSSVFPDFIAEGAIDLVLSKPIRRVQVFLVKYLGSLLFVLLQVALFCAGVFFCVGLRLGEWKWSIFSAVPLLVVFFSYLYSVNVLLALVTRSTIAALLLTILFWFGIGIVQGAEGLLNRFRIQAEVTAEAEHGKIEQLERQIAQHDQEPTPPQGAEDGEPEESPAESAPEKLKDARRAYEHARTNSDQLAAWRTAARAVLAVLPKTGETIALLERWLTADAEHTMAGLFLRQMTTEDQDQKERMAQQREVVRRTVEEVRSRSAWFIIGTSLGFETVVLAAACVIFARRDF